MSRLSIVIASLVAVVAIGAGVAWASDGGYGGGHAYPKHVVHPGVQHLRQSKISFSAYLTGQAEVNDQGQRGAGDPAAQGSVTLLAANSKTLCYGVTLRGAEPPTMFHVHHAPAGQNGDVVIDLSKGVPKDSNGNPAGSPGAAGGCKTLAGTELQAFHRLLVDPRDYYVNVHTASFPKGAARGQLSRLLFNNN